jgi:soluble epoxide hydrolase/lipid-phosphate phosphatase
MGDMVGDLVCILEHAAVKSAICMGYESRFIAIDRFPLMSIDSSLRHDWGAQICYEAARMRPDIFKAVAGLVIPVSCCHVVIRVICSTLSHLLQYIPSGGPFLPITKLVVAFPALAYQVFFEDHTAAAIVELDKNTTRTIRATLRTVDSPPPAAFLKSKDSFLSGWKDVDIVRGGSLHIIMQEYL